MHTGRAVWEICEALCEMAGGALARERARNFLGFRVGSGVYMHNFNSPISKILDTNTYRLGTVGGGFFAHIILTRCVYHCHRRLTVGSTAAAGTATCPCRPASSSSRLASTRGPAAAWDPVGSVIFVTNLSNEPFREALNSSIFFFFIPWWKCPESVSFSRHCDSLLGYTLHNRLDHSTLCHALGETRLYWTTDAHSCAATSVKQAHHGTYMYWYAKTSTHLGL